MIFGFFRDGRRDNDGVGGYSGERNCAEWTAKLDSLRVSLGISYLHILSIGKIAWLVGSKARIFIPIEF